MSDLTIQELEEKIKMVQKDIDSLMSTGGAGRKLEVLSEYKQYLEDELRVTKQERRDASLKKA